MKAKALAQNTPKLVYNIICNFEWQVMLTNEDKKGKTPYHYKNL
jgi:hypothetical protein